MGSNREERERLRQERIAAQKSVGSSDRQRLILGYIVAAILGAAVLAGLVFVLIGGDDGGGEEEVAAGCDNASIEAEIGVFADYECDNREGTEPPEIQFGDLEESAAKAGCDLNLGLPNDGSTHFTDETKGNYKTNPPTSGDHLGNNEHGSGAVADGAYLTTPPESRLVHSMEHSRIVIRYAPDLPEADQLALKGVFDESPGGMVLVPDPDLPFDVAVSAWQNYVGCKSYDPLSLDVLRNFRDTFRGNGPESVPFSL